MNLWLSERQAQEIAHHALTQLPAEACGLIAGNDGKAEQIIPIPNVAADSLHHFEMDAEALVNAMFAIEKQGLSLIGIYHSHPNGQPIPSQTDIRESHYPDVRHLIVGLANDAPMFAAWQIRHYEVDKVNLSIGPVPQTDSRSLSTEQKTAVILSMVVAFIFMILLSLSLLPPAPQIP